jgi:hypothetical protein
VRLGGDSDEWEEEGFDDFDDDEDESEHGRVAVIVERESESAPMVAEESARRNGGMSIMGQKPKKKQVIAPARIQKGPDYFGTEVVEEPKKDVVDFNSLGMGIAYTAPKRAFAKTVQNEVQIDLSSSRTFALDKLISNTEAGGVGGWDDEMDLKVAKRPAMRAAPRINKDRLKLSVSATAVYVDDDPEDIDFDL